MRKLENSVTFPKQAEYKIFFYFLQNFRELGNIAKGKKKENEEIFKKYPN